MNATPQALAAVRAAKNVKRWGADAAIRYALKHGASIPMVRAAMKFESRRTSH